MNFDFINIIGTIYDNSINHVVALAEQIFDRKYTNRYGKTGLNQYEINKDLLDRINNIPEATEEKSKGCYTSLESLNELQPTPSVGDWAIVKNNNNWYLVKCETEGQWTLTNDEFKLGGDINLKGYLKEEDLSNFIKTINDQSLIITNQNDTNITIENSENQDIDLVSVEKDGLFSKSDYLDYLKIKEETLPKLRVDIDELYDLVGVNPEEIQGIIDKYNIIKEFVDSLDPNTDPLDGLLSNVAKLQGEVATLKSEVADLKKSRGMKHVVLTKRQYNKLSTYEEDTIYLIIEPDQQSQGWGLGDDLPIIIAANNNNNEEEVWKFGQAFPIIFE